MQNFIENIKINHELNKCDLQSFLKISNSNFEEFPSKYVCMFENLNVRTQSLMSLVPSKHLQRWLDANYGALESSLQETENLRYFHYFSAMRDFQRSLQPPLFDAKAIKSAAQAQDHDGLRERILEFAPDSKGRAPRTVYSNCGTVTGRLTVVEGPNPLVMRGDVKSALRSRHRNGRVLQLDLSAAEPRTALNVIGKNLDGDVYERIAEDVLEGKVTRQVAKQVVICALYGQSSKNLAQSLPLDVNAASVIRKVKDFFEYEKLLSMIRSTSPERNRIRNALGRPIVVAEPTDSMLLSYYLQSSAAEISILLFADFCRRMGNYVEPLYVIHDALLVDCDEESASFLLDKKSINLRHEGWNYPVKVSEIEAR